MLQILNWKLSLKTVSKLASPFPKELVVHEAAAVAAEGHGLILKVTLSTLVTDGTIQRVVH